MLLEYNQSTELWVFQEILDIFNVNTTCLLQDAKSPLICATFKISGYFCPIVAQRD